MKKAIEVTIMGQKFAVKSDSNEDYVVEVAGFVDNKVNEVLGNTKAVASVQVALLTAMNIADEFFKFRNDKADRLGKAEKKIQDMIELIDLHV